MKASKLNVPKLSNQLLRPNPEIPVIRDEKSKLIGKVEIGLVVRRGGQENALALGQLNELVDGTVASSLTVPQIMAFVENDQTKTAWNIR